MIEIATVGHSNRSLADFLALLDAHGIRGVADVRRHPGSRWNPHFSRDALSAGLAGAGISYRHFEALGGRRQPSPESPHTALVEPQLRGYADHMESAEFARGLDDLLRWGAEQPVALMCAEARPEECHRRLLSDALTLASARVVHLLDAARRQPHAWSPHLRAEGRRAVYDVGPLRLDLG